MHHNDAGEFFGEVFIHRFEPGPGGYDENGIWIQGGHDYAAPFGWRREPALGATRSCVHVSQR